VVVALECRDFNEAENQFRKPLLCAEIANLDGRYAFNPASCSVRLTESLKAPNQVDEVNDS
jgi:hypothetical protein